MSIYFAGDFHLGVPDYESSLVREKKICAWLDYISADAEEIYLMGDIFDFWFEYKRVIPKYHTRFLGKIAELVDKGIDVYFFKGNHDMWMFHYFQKELGITLVSDELIIERYNRRLFLHHGDGLGKGESGYKILRKIFRNTWAQRFFSLIPPRIGIGLALMLSNKSRISQKGRYEKYLGDDKELLFQFANNYDKEKRNIDYFVFGHRHLVLHRELENGSIYINTGEWVNQSHYAKLSESGMELLKFQP